MVCAPSLSPSRRFERWTSVGTTPARSRNVDPTVGAPRTTANSATGRPRGAAPSHPSQSSPLRVDPRSPPPCSGAREGQYRAMCSAASVSCVEPVRSGIGQGGADVSPWSCPIPRDCRHRARARMPTHAVSMRERRLTRELRCAEVADRLRRCEAAVARSANSASASVSDAEVRSAASQPRRLRSDLLGCTTSWHL
jgi:hypothetical protein